MRESKLFQVPEFDELPPHTDAANVKENIDLWLEKKDEDKFKQRIKNYLVKVDDPEKEGYKGYRFIDPKDFYQEIKKEIVISKVPFEVLFSRTAHQPDLGFCPLYIKEESITATFKCGEYEFPFVSDNNLKQHIKFLKDNKMVPDNK